MNTTHRYRYELPPGTTVVGILFYLGLSAWMVHLARSYSEVPHVGCMALSVIFSILALVVLVRRLAFPCTLELTDDAILLPCGHPWPRITTIPYADIISIEDRGDCLTVATGSGSFGIGAIRFEGYRAVREVISAKTEIPLQPLRQTGNGLKFDSYELPEPLVQWAEPEDWTRFRIRTEISKPVLYQLRTELWFFVRCYAFCCAFIVVPFLGFVLLPWVYAAGPVQLVTVSISCFGVGSVLAIFITLLHWLYGIYPVRPETKVSFRDRGITCLLLNGQKCHWNYREFCGWTVIERHFKEHILQILVLKRVSKGQACNVEFALPDVVVRDQVSQLLNDRQVPNASDLKPSWEEV
ncbi:MAG: hypothetical protein JWM11_3107 [Planctomycetaceae bacterium]|nr:hypothetical protein [Planctomycetaceae bacterium]